MSARFEMRTSEAHIAPRLTAARVSQICKSVSTWCAELIPYPQSGRVPNHEKTVSAPDTVRRLKLVPPGGKLADVELGYGSNYRRLDPDQPSWTVTATCYSDQIHPSEDRLLTARELARLQSFPDQWRFIGPRRGQQGKRLVAHIFAQIGNAVPPLLAYHIGAHLMRKVFEKKRNVRAISLFSGAGGMDIGFEAAGVEVRACVEYDRYAAATLRANRRYGRVEGAHNILANAVVMRQDISSLPTKRLLRAARLEAAEVDLIFGGPPCQAFSLAGQREGFSDHRGLLVDDFLRTVREIRPRVVVFENVKGIRSTQGGAALKHVRGVLDDLGYQVTECLLNAATFGVAQFRERVFLLCIQGSERVSIPEITHFDSKAAPILNLVGLSDFETVADALKGLPAAYEGSVSAKKVAETISGRKEKQDWSLLRKKQFLFPEDASRTLLPVIGWLADASLNIRYREDVSAACVLALQRNSAASVGMSVEDCIDFMRQSLGAVLPEKARDACRSLVLMPLVEAGLVGRAVGIRGDERFVWLGPDPTVEGPGTVFYRRPARSL